MINKTFWKNRTISTKIGLVISIGIITSILTIVIGAVTFLKKEYLTTFGKQQYTTVQAFALYVDADLTSKLKAISVVADITPPEIMADSSSAQTFLANRTGILSLFDDGLMLLSADGKLLAEMPFISSQRFGNDYSSSPFYQQASKGADPIISEPFSSIKPNQQPVIEMMVPIRDASGKIYGYLCGGMTLNGDNSLGNIAKRQVGESGYFYIYSQDRTILVHPDNTRMMQKDVPQGANRLFDRALQGFDGSGETVNSRGLYAMSSFQHLKAAPWILAANLPMKEVLTPFYSSQRMIILVITICGVGALLFSWWALLRFTAPLHRFAAQMKNCYSTGEPLAEVNGPELNFVITEFNKLLAQMQASQAELAANEEMQRTLINASPDTICFKDDQGRWLLANEADLALFQLEGVDYRGKKDSELAAYTPFYHDEFLSCERTDEKAWVKGETLVTEEVIPIPEKENKILEVIKTPIFHPDGRRKALVVIGRDISARKKNEASLRQLSQAVEQCPVSIVITNTAGTIEFVNPAFTQHTGYTFEEAIGQNPRILKTNKNLPETYAQLWQTISSGKVWEGEFYNIKKNGEEFIEHAIISPVLNDNGEITHYMAIKEDISAKKQSEEIIWKQANFDHLTRLPNRRLFLYRLKQALTSTHRDHSSIALLFLDLDCFKEVNDTLGHDQGDVLLVEVARRLLECVRDTDTVARFGGDEFILLLTSIKLEAGIDKVTKKVLESLKKPYYFNSHVVTCISASIGVTTCPEDADDINTLLKNADRAMYLAKASGRNCWRSFKDVCVADRQQEKERHVEI
jgi:diguanylate cyclase (GGDEF)-like protein/PAS domain S-box-containing protein